MCKGINDIVQTGGKKKESIQNRNKNVKKERIQEKVKKMKMMELAFPKHYN